MECVDLGSSHSTVNRFGKIEKDWDSLMGIGGKPGKIKGSVELSITLEDRDRKRTLRQSFIMARVDVPYNVIFSKLLLNEVCVVMSP